MGGAAAEGREAAARVRRGAGQGEPPAAAAAREAHGRKMKMKKKKKSEKIEERRVVCRRLLLCVSAAVRDARGAWSLRARSSSHDGEEARWRRDRDHGHRCCCVCVTSVSSLRKPGGQCPTSAVYIGVPARVVR